MTKTKKKKQELFIIVAGTTPYLGVPEDREEMAEDNNYPDVIPGLQMAKISRHTWRQWDAEISHVDDPPMDFKIYKLVEVK